MTLGRLCFVGVMAAVATARADAPMPGDTEANAKAFLVALRKAVEAKDPKQLLQKDLAVFPLTVVQATRTERVEPTEFISDYDEIFSARVTRAILGADVEHVSALRGELGGGAVHFSCVHHGKTCRFQITSVNP